MVHVDPYTKLTRAAAAAAIAAVMSRGDGVRAAESQPALVVKLDQAKLISLPRGARKIVVGRSIIAHVTPLPDGLHAVLTGTSFGETNMMVLDGDGTVTMDSIIRVEAPSDSGPVVQRGQQRTTYSCTPRCEIRLQAGDTGKETTDIKMEIQTRISHATAQPVERNPTMGRNGAL